MDDLTKHKCVACRVGAPKATPSEIAELKPQIPDWNMTVRDGIEQLERSYDFSDFAEALAFTVKIGDLAETEGHHPAILTEWGKATVYWWTHKIGGLHFNDFIMAAKTDKVYATGHYPPPA